MAGPEYKGVRKRYFESLKQFRQLPVVELSSDPQVVVNDVAPLLKAELASSPESSFALRRLPPDAQTRLAEFVALLLARCGGLSFDDYSRLFPGSASIRLPKRAALFKSLSDEFGSAELPTGTSADEIEAFFRSIYALSAVYERGKAMITGFSAGGGFRCAARVITSDSATFPGLGTFMSESQQATFAGAVAQALPVFESPPTDWPTVRDRQPHCVQTQVGVVVRNLDGDFYPLWFNFYYDEVESRWILFSATRSCSVRMLSLPPFVF